MPHRLSVVIPAFNAGQYIEEALQSVISQTGNDSQIVVIDDGSTDETAAILSKYPNVHYERQPHGGAAAARNLGIDRSDGEILAFLDADDTWAPGAVQLLAGCLESDAQLDAVFGYVEEFADRSLANPGAALLRRQPGYRAGSMFIRSASFHKVGKFDTSFVLGQFVDWLARAQMCSLRTRTLPDVVLRRRIHEGNSTRRRDEVADNLLKVARAAVARHRQNGINGNAVFRANVIQPAFIESDQAGADGKLQLTNSEVSRPDSTG